MFAVLCLIALGLGYWVGQPKQTSEKESAGNTEDKGEESGEKETGNAESKEEGHKEATPENPEFLKKGLVAYYPFNGNAKDESGNGYNGDVSGASLTIDKNGTARGAYIFDGSDDCIHITNANTALDFGPGDSYTLSAWVYVYDDDDRKPIVDTYGYGIEVSTQERLELTMVTGMFNAGHNYRSLYSPLMIPTSGWQHIAGVLEDTGNAATQKLFVNGILVASKTGDQMGAGYPLYPRIGSSKHVNGIFYNGKIDDVRIYNRALSKAEEKALYEFEKTN